MSGPGPWSTDDVRDLMDFVKFSGDELEKLVLHPLDYMSVRFTGREELTVFHPVEAGLASTYQGIPIYVLSTAPRGLNACRGLSVLAHSSANGLMKYGPHGGNVSDCSVCKVLEVMTS